MPTTNISLAKHLNGNPLLEGEIKVGLKVLFPSGAGGVLQHKCISCDSIKAEFSSTNPDWPSGYTVKFNQPDFSLHDFQLLNGSLKAFEAFGETPTIEQRAIVHRAHELGYAYQCSHTQASWTEKGVASFQALKNVSCLDLAMTRVMSTLQ